MITDILQTVLGNGNVIKGGKNRITVFAQNFMLLPLFPLRTLLKIRPLKIIFDATCAKAVFMLAQYRSDRFLKIQRRNTVEQDYNMSESLAFSGEEL